MRDGSGQPASPMTLAGTPATVVLFGTGLSTTEPDGDAGAMADLDIAEDLGAGADQDAAADLGMAVAGLLAGAAERHAVQDRDVVLDHRGLADHEAGGVVEEDAAPDPRGRMDVALEHRRRRGSAGSRRNPGGPCSTASAPADGSGWRGSP